VQILKHNSNYVSGKATPNSEVELFYTHNCNDLCEGKTYIATVQAGSDGRWEYNAPLMQNVTATASLLSATTSPFSTAKLLDNEAILKHVTCNANGSITIPEDREGFTFSWVKIESNGTRVPIGNTQSVSNLDVGTYEVTIDDGCKAFPNVFSIRDQKLTKPTVTAPSPSCGQTNFSFAAEVLRGSGTIRYEWRNSSGTVVSINNPAILPEGTYIVTAKDDSGCAIDSDPVTVKRRPSPIINTTTLIRTPASCGIPNGAIRGITIGDATGNVTYKWFKHDPTTGIIINTVVGTDIDLIDVEGGLYTLQVTDEGTCSPVSMSFSIGINNIIVISGGNITPGRCGLDNGIIDNVSITNADKYEWLKVATNEIILAGAYAPGTSIKISDLAPGSYILKASNSTSVCSYTRTFVVPLVVPQTYTFNQTVVNTTCELDNGSISLNFTSIPPTRYVWKDELGNEYTGTIRELKNLPVGVYLLYAYDVNNCEKILGPFTINATPKLVIEPNSATVKADGCELKRGSITGISVTGGLGDYTFKWMNEAGEPVQTTKDLTNVGSGTYYLEVKDRSACGIAISQTYTVGDVYFPLVTPEVKDIRVCYVSDITVPIIAPEEGTYQLFTSATDAIPLLETTNGIFQFKVAKTATYYIRRKLGVCLSDFTTLHIEVTHDNLEIGNVITPNGDGSNDFWMLKGLPDYKGNSIKVYSRSGQLVYEAVGDYTKPFDGRFRGKELPAGVYFYLIDLRAECKPISGSITLLR
jgi:gliding motility-associated-like protein